MTIHYEITYIVFHSLLITLWYNNLDRITESISRTSWPLEHTLATPTSNTFHRRTLIGYCKQRAVVWVHWCHMRTLEKYHILMASLWYTQLAHVVRVMWLTARFGINLIDGLEKLKGDIEISTNTSISHISKWSND